MVARGWKRGNGLDPKADEELWRRRGPARPWLDYNGDYATG